MFVLEKPLSNVDDDEEEEEEEEEDIPDEWKEDNFVHVVNRGVQVSVALNFFSSPASVLNLASLS